MRKLTRADLRQVAKKLRLAEVPQPIGGAYDGNGKRYISPPSLMSKEDVDILCSMFPALCNLYYVEDMVSLERSNYAVFRNGKELRLSSTQVSSLARATDFKLVGDEELADFYLMELSCRRV